MKVLFESFNKISNNAYLYAVITKVISVILVMLYSIVYSRYFGPEIKGAGDVIFHYSDFIKIVVCLGIYQAYPYFKKSKGDVIYYEFINITFGLFFLYLGIAIAAILFIRLSLFYLSIAILVPIMFAIQQLNYVVLIERPRTRNSAQVLIDIIDIILVSVLMFVVEASFKICILYLIVRHIIHLLIAIKNLKIPILSIRPTLANSSSYIKFGWIPMITILFMEINYKADVIMMENFNVAKAAIGVYTLGLILAQKIWLIPDALKDILLSKLAKGKSISEVTKVTRISFLIVVIFTVLLAIIGKPAIFFLYGNDYADAYYVILILLIGVIGMVFYKMIYSFNVVNGKRFVNMFLLGIAAIINIILNIFLIPTYGMIGAAISSTLSYFLCGIVFLCYFCKVYKIHVTEMTIIKNSDIEILFSLIKKFTKGS